MWSRRSVVMSGSAMCFAAATAHAATTAAKPQPFLAAVPAPDGTPLSLRDWGRGEAVVFVHAWALNSAVWEYVMTATVEAGFRAVAFDRRGHGQTPDPGRGYDYATLADDLDAVLRSLDLRRVTLVGHSMGCTEIAHYLQRHGTARVARAVFVSAPGPDASDALAASFLAGLRQDRPGFLAGGLELFGGAVIKPGSPMAQWVLAQFLQASPYATRECLKLAMQVPLRPALGAVKLPTLLVHGGQDALNPFDRTAVATAREIAGSRLQRIDDAPHGLPVTHHRELTAAVLSFITQAG